MHYFTLAAIALNPNAKYPNEMLDEFRAQFEDDSDIFTKDENMDKQGMDRLKDIMGFRGSNSENDTI